MPLIAKLAAMLHLVDSAEVYTQIVVKRGARNEPGMFYFRSYPMIAHIFQLIIFEKCLRSSSKGALLCDSKLREGKSARKKLG